MDKDLCGPECPKCCQIQAFRNRERLEQIKKHKAEEDERRFNAVIEALKPHFLAVFRLLEGRG